MPRISVAFLTVAALCGMAGMIWGGFMGATENMTMAPAHAHLNLLGWVTLAIMGAVYALPAGPSANRLAWTNFVLSAGGVLIMIPMLAWLLPDPASRGPVIGPWFLLPEAMVFIGLLLFLVNIWRSRGRPAAA
ncbi:MAG TPA: hypothetical protein VGS12_08850 [Caulobacteraceae bacterium]|nr:hypothetical protein [Caulobacteraceae bacterium]